MTGSPTEGDTTTAHGECDERTVAGGLEGVRSEETPPRALLLMNADRNRTLLERLLDRSMTVIATTDPGRLSDDIDLCIVDREHLSRHRDALADRHEAEEPLFFPILLIAPGEVASRVETWALVDEVVQVPISKAVFTARIRGLLFRRQQSRRMLDRERELEAALERLRVRERAIAAAPIGVSIADATADDLPIVYINDGFCELTGYDRAEVLGHNCRFLQGPLTDDETVAEIRAAIDASEPVSVDIVNYTREGERFWNKLDIAPVHHEDGTLTHFIGFQTDITERKLHEQRVNVLNRVLRHNLRNELNIIDGYAETLGGNDVESADAIGHIRSAVDRLVGLSDEVRHVEQVFGARWELSDYQPVATFVERVRETLVDQHPDVTVHTECPDSRVRIDAGTLLVGCVDYLTMLLGRNDCADREVTVSATLTDEDTVDICLRDNGPGPSEIEWHVIEAGYETPLEHADKLGLWVLRWVTTTVGGELVRSVDSNTLHLVCPVRDSRGGAVETATDEHDHREN